ncbi:MAG TPA: amidohydrolase [Syntrophomonadaceae bacterium]|nr:amidohydrolase [Syntrophomonadaceae bacterium]
MKLLIKNCVILPMGGAHPWIENGFLIAENGRILQLGEGEAPQAAYDRVIDGHNRVLMPGLVNTHTHAAMTLLRGYADDLPLMEWLQTKVWPLEAKLTGEDIYWGSLLAIAEMLRSGTTCFADMYFFMDRVAQAVEESGMRAVLSRGMIGVGPESELAFSESRTLVEKWHRQAGERISFMLGPHAPYTCPPEYLKRVTLLADQLGVGIHIHLAETRGEFDDIMRDYGLSPTAHLQACGVMDRPVLAAHCVHLTPEDINILEKHKVGVAHNPQSNMKLASGIAPVPEMLAAGIAVSLGTDGASSNNDLDLIQEMRSASLLHKVNTMDPTVVPAYQALEMATVHGSRALGLEKEIGCLAPGMKADMILLKLDVPHMLPRYDLVANLVYSSQAGDVDTVIIDGRIIMENRQIKTFDEAEVLRQVQLRAIRLADG